MKSSFFKKNRKRLLNELGSGAPVVLPAHGQMQMSRDTEYPFQQDRNFFYLCGINLPDWILVIEDSEEYLIEPQLSATEKIFNGDPDRQQVVEVSGIEKIVSYKEGWKKLSGLKKARSLAAPEVLVGNVFTNPSRATFLKKLDASVEDITPTVLKLRTIKQPDEIEEIRTAVEITGEAFGSAREELDSLDNESQLEALFTGYFAALGTRHAYNPIVAAGTNACTLHYTANNGLLTGSELVLIDIGAQSNYYAADITRTWEFGDVSERLAEVNQAVRTAFDEIHAVMKPGLAFDKYQHAVDEVMTDTIGKLGLKNDEEGLRKYFPHAPTHGLGLDVHDPIVGYTEFTPGMVLTLEPGIYIPDEGIGVRHEDDLLITDKNVENLSVNIQ